MCLTWCHRLSALYWNHEDCQRADCPFAGQIAPCASCRHRREETTCGLTNAPLPAAGGCCHWNIDRVEGAQEVTPRMLELLGMGPAETVEMVLKNLEAPYQRDPQGRTLVDPDELGLPATYGLGTDHRPPEIFDWSAWQGQWCAEEIYN